MKKSIISFVLAAAVITLTGCCYNGGCGGYVRNVSCCNAYPVYATTCNSCAYGYGYNDWY